MDYKQEKYGLFTAITMIVGICIGSGIFFKSDNILIATDGSIFLGVLVFAIGAMAIIFGGLCFSELASRTNNPGGVVTYMEEFSGKRAACSFGWFQTLIYYPTLAVVVSWVVGIFTCILFNLENTLELQLLIGSAFCVLCFIYNTLSAKLGGIFQNAATIIKLIPLVLLAVFGLVFGNPIEGLSNISSSQLMGVTWISAIGPIAFSYDGWVVSTSISHEVKNSKSNMPKALIIAPIVILICYILYFVGITTFVGPEKVLAMGDAHVQYAAERLFGSFFAKAITVFVIISVMGTVNGLVLGFIRMPYSMSIREGMFPFAKKLSVVNKKLDMPVNSAIFAFLLSIFWLLIHYITTKFALLPNSDVSEIAIAVSYVFYILLYYRVFKLYQNKEIKSVWKGIICPILAAIGSGFILLGALQSKLVFLYAVICVIVIITALVFYEIKMKKN